jgi:hypothetical protein
LTHSSISPLFSPTKECGIAGKRKSSSNIICQ